MRDDSSMRTHPSLSPTRTDEQSAALDSLARAFKKCKRAGIVFFGMDEDLLAFDHDALVAAGWLDEDLDALLDSHRALKRVGQGQQVDTHGTYMGSGGW